MVGIAMALENENLGREGGKKYEGKYRQTTTREGFLLLLSLPVDKSCKVQQRASARTVVRRHALRSIVESDCGLET